VFQDGWKKTISPTTRNQQLMFQSSIHPSYKQNFVLLRTEANRPWTSSLSGRFITPHARPS